MSLIEMEHAIHEAETQLRNADSATERMARMIRKRLRHVSHYILTDLKRELSQYNANTKTWREAK